MILEVLALAPGRCLPATALVRKLQARGHTKGEVLRSLRSLHARGIVWENDSASRGNPEFCLGVTVPRATAARHAVLQVATKEEAITTAELARLAGVESSAASGACRMLESHGWLERGDPARKRQLLFPLTGETLNSQNYERIDSIRRDLGEIVSAHEPGDLALLRALEKFLRELSQRADLEEFEEQIRSGSHEILQSARTAKTRTGIKASFDLKTYFREVPTWRRITDR